MPEGEIPREVLPVEEREGGDADAEMIEFEIDDLYEGPVEVEPLSKEPAVARPIEAPPGAQIVEPTGPSRAPGRRRKLKERKVGAVLDYWEPVPGRFAWVRHHVWSRKQLFVPTSVGADGNGPDTELTMSGSRSTP